MHTKKASSRNAASSSNPNSTTAACDCLHRKNQPPYNAAMSLLRSLACSLLCLSTTAPLAAEWHRIVQSGKGDSKDISAAHPLAYFTQNPFLRDDAGSLCPNCGPEGKANIALHYKANVKVRHVGVIRGLPILELDYNFTAGEGTFTSDWISILIKTGRRLTTRSTIFRLMGESLA